MAKQTFTIGQVLLASQLTDLQQTAMLGGSASIKTVSYTLVAADAGSTVAMNSASSTTITVNQNLFSAGDIVTIYNTNTGVSTITAGTATVTTSGSLTLSQNQGGVLHFTSASAAIFFQFATPAAAAGGGMTSLATGTLSTGTVTLSAIDQTYNDLSLRIYKPSTTSASGTVYFRYNGITTASYKYNYLDTSTTTVNGDTGKTSLDLFVAGTAVTNTYIQLDFPGYSLVSGQTVGKAFDFFAAIEASGKSQYGQCFVDTATAQAPITSITIFTAAGTFDAGTYTLWGIK